MPLPPLLHDRLVLPLIGAPLFIVSVPELVIAQCKAGIVGSFPALNARPKELLEEWIVQIKTELADYSRANPERARRALCRQSDRARLQRPAGARHRRVREASGADHDHQPARAAVGGRGRALLRRHRAARRDQRAPRPQGGRGRRRRPDPGLRGRRRTCRRAEPVRPHGRGAQLVQGHHRAVRLDRQRRGRAGRAGDGRRPRLCRHALHRHARGQRQARVQADADRHQRRRHRLHARCSRACSPTTSSRAWRRRATTPTTCRPATSPR